MSRRCTAALLAAAFVLTVAPSARADWFASEAVDGPADIVKVGGVDLGRDGHGAVVYLRRDAGVAHVFVSRIYDGAFHAPEQVDVGIPEEATDAAVAAADDHRLVVVWISGNRVYGSFTPGGAVGTMSPPQLLADPGGQPHDVDVDMGINGTAYATFTVPGAGGSDVAAVRLQGSTWEAVPQPLDIDPSRAAGAGTGRARVAVSAEGNAVATWGEAGAIFARRITGLNVSVAPQLVSLVGGVADSPDIDVEDDGSFAWVVFRQDLDGVSQAVARRLVGSQFEAPAFIGAPGATPRASRWTSAALARRSPAWATARSLSRRSTTTPSARRRGSTRAAAPSRRWRSASARTSPPRGCSAPARWPGATAPRTSSSARRRCSRRPSSARSRPARCGWRPTAPATTRSRCSRATRVRAGLAVAVYDRPPGAPFIYSSTRFQKRRRPELKWRAGLDLWARRLTT